MYKVYRAIRATNVNTDAIGISWAIDQLAAENFGEQFGEPFIVISAYVKANQINVPQTNAQWLSIEHCTEQEVVLHEHEDISIIVEGEVINNANTGAMPQSQIETRPDPEQCRKKEILNHLEYYC